MKSTFLYYFFIVVIGSLISGPVVAQVSLSPTAIFIKDQTNVASLYVTNNSKVAQEIGIAFEFAYPGSDERGNMITVTNDSVSSIRFELTSSIKAFPRQVVLQPGGQQIIRLQVRPRQDRPDGVYWTRLILSSQSAATDIDTVRAAQGIGTKINYVLKQNIPVFYLKGKVTTGLTVGTVNTSVEKGKLVAVSRLTPSGNAPFNGSVTARLINGTGKEVAVQKQTMIAYFEVLRRIELTLPSSGLTTGKYTLDFTYETKRSDIPFEDLVQAKSVKKSVTVEIE
jgi:hypothetical protein